MREKEFLHRIGLPTTPFCPVTSAADLEQAVQRLGVPAVLKTAAWGYDGKGQVKVSAAEQSPAAWDAIQSAEAVLERWVDFACEISVVGARGGDGQIACYEPFANVHRNHILDQTTSPADVEPGVAAAAIEATRAILNQLDVVGVLCVEFFVTHSGDVLVNEIAPRPHNSGHLTIDAHTTSQFEQQVRAVCGLPLGSTAPLRPAAMVNLLGDIWTGSEPDWSAACAFSGVKLHLYGKREPRPGRKMGHLTALGDSAAAAAEIARDARAKL